MEMVYVYVFDLLKTDIFLLVASNSLYIAMYYVFKVDLLSWANQHENYKKTQIGYCPILLMDDEWAVGGSELT